MIPQNKPQAAAIYVRMSKDSELGIDRQLQDCQAKAAELGWPVAVVFDADNEVSATKRKPRPDYERLLTAVRAGRVDAVICWDIDRLTRTPREIEDVIDLADKGLQLASCGGIADLATPQGQMTARIKATVARHEVDQLKRRMKRSLAQRAAAGKVHGRAPYGWQTELADGRRIGADELDPQAAEVIRGTAQRLLAGESVRSIVADLNDRAVPAARGGQWSTQVLRTMMLRDSNCGRRVHLGKVVAATADRPAILSEDIHDRVVSLLTDPGRVFNPGAPKRHLLSKLARCGKCGETMTSNPGRPPEKATPTKRAKAPGYVCTACFGVRKVQAPVDELVTELVLRRLEQPDAADLLAQPGRAQEVAAQREKAAGLQARLSRAADDYADDKITADQLARITAKLRPQIEAAQHAMRGAMPRAELAVMAGPGAREHWATAPLDVRRQVINALMTVTIMPTGGGRRPFDPSCVQIDWHDGS